MGEEASDVEWRDIIDSLKNSGTAEIPFSSDQDREKKRQRLERRAERNGLQIESTVANGVLQVRRVGEVAQKARDRGEDDAERRERRERREQREQGGQREERGKRERRRGDEG